MAECAWCGQEMTASVSCAVEAFHCGGRDFPRVRWGREPGWGPLAEGERCFDCGTPLGGVHHPGCDIEQCPACRGQALSCGCSFEEDTAPAVPTSSGER